MVIDLTIKFSGITILSVLVYYCTIAIISTNGLAKLIQPQLNGVVYGIFESLRVEPLINLYLNLLGVDCPHIYSLGCRWTRYHISCI